MPLIIFVAIWLILRGWRKSKPAQTCVQVNIHMPKDISKGIPKDIQTEDKERIPIPVREQVSTRDQAELKKKFASLVNG